MKNSLKAVLLIVLVFGFAGLLFWLTKGHAVAVMQPKGAVAYAERNLILTATALMLTVVIPVFLLTFFIAWRYRAGNKKAKYTPTWEHNSLEEFIWWGVPCTIIFALAIITWKSSHELDPFRPLESSNPQMTIQVVALNWKWLFLYPAEHIATVNYVEFPADTPVDFVLTSDGAMNSFWLPQLGGQIYAMPGMVTHVHLDGEIGTYAGSSANLSGDGFSGMKFTARVVPRAEFDQWVRDVRATPLLLDAPAFNELSALSKNVAPMTYSDMDEGIFDAAVRKYMTPGTMVPSMNTDDMK